MGTWACRESALAQGLRAEGNIIPDYVKIDEKAERTTIQPLGSPTNFYQDGHLWQRWEGATIIDPVTVWRRVRG